MRKESQTLEYKETMTKTYLKTVSAFANYTGGEIVFGISDDLLLVPIPDPGKMSLDIETQINDSISPRPDYSLKENGDGTISLFVKKGEMTPYLYNGKAYKRHDTATVEVGELERERLILKGQHLSYEELPSGKSGLEFTVLSRFMKERLSVEELSLDTLKSLGLYSEKDGYNNAAYWLSDANEAPGLDIVVYGDNPDLIKRRITLSHLSLLRQYEEAIRVHEEECTYEKIAGATRERLESVPLSAFREAIANSLVHRQYDVKANTKVEISKDGITISSPGGLMEGMSKEEFLAGSFSLPRNEKICSIFLRLRFIEALGTGIGRIKRSYSSSLTKPIFVAREESVTVFLPRVDSLSLSPNEALLLGKLRKSMLYSRSDIEKLVPLKKNTLIRTLNSLLEKGIIIKEGEGKSTLYSLN